MAPGQYRAIAYGLLYLRANGSVDFRMMDLRRTVQMRSRFQPATIAILTAILFTSIAIARGPQQGGNVLFNKLNNGPGGPAPRHDLSGSWTGPVQAQLGEVPPMTPLGKQLFSANKPERQFNVKGTNDNFVKTCDPMGFPYNAVYEIRGIAFGTMPDRILVLSQMQRVWREVWMDKRELPKNVGGTEKGSPDPRYYGYSVGRWEGDNTLVIDTTGLDEKTWLDTTRQSAQRRRPRGGALYSSGS
jgi:hypothetical protein